MNPGSSEDILEKAQHLDTTFGALSDPTRRAIVARLVQRTLTVTEIAKPFTISLPAVSKHLHVLERAGLIRRQKKGRTHRCILQPEPIRQAAHWIGRYRRFWESRLDALAEYLELSEKEESLWKTQASKRTASRERSGPRRRKS